MVEQKVYPLGEGSVYYKTIGENHAETPPRQHERNDVTNLQLTIPLSLSASPTLDTYTRFSPLDEIMPPIYYGVILAFESQSTDTNSDYVFSILRTGLSKVAERYPILTSEFARDASNHLVLEQSTSLNEIPLVLKDLTEPGSEPIRAYQELKKSGMTGVGANILAPIVAGIETTSKLMSAQVTFIPGGMFLSMSFTHLLFDSHSGASIIRLWATLCRELQQNVTVARIREKGVKPGDNPVIALAKRLRGNYEELKGRPELWEVLGLDWRKSGSTPPEASFTMPLFIPAAASSPLSPDSSQLISTIFSFSRSALASLKIIATAPTSISSNVEDFQISTHDALVAFLWRHILRARLDPHDKVPYDRESMLAVAVNGRKELSISECHIGNVIFESPSSHPIRDVLSGEASLAQLAQTIRLNLNKNKKLFPEALVCASSIPSQALSSLRYLIDDFVSQDILTTSWVALPYYSMEWGPAFSDNGGYIDFFRWPEGQFPGSNCILPRKMNGDVEVVLNMKEEQMRRLIADKKFLEMASLVA
ncbi:hypothetical protein BPAE_0340g00030 [Botrytis paeoniae]|uniref:Condensation domain-containing protein n=1 Tax=Botrytis paeoniae TaxID=278948 RepID=A0A4Z1F7V9_9HELO|nr:hypothetical protein BPAE_0340g00030 [Botrytis paeoniae]